ncbi:MAG: hypothetical protein JNK53_07975 [Phycisphaerae bacterium]|nr:hypothetical protein [Phycisphaerae bacterium]
MAVAIWWSMLTASCLIEALRGRSPTLNASALAVASLMAAAASVTALAGPMAWTDPISYVPLGIAFGLGTIALQFRDAVAYVTGADATTVFEEPDEDTRRTLIALGSLARMSLAMAPIALVIALSVLLPSGGRAVAAAGCVCGLVINRKHIGTAYVLPAVILAALIALIAVAIASLEGAMSFRLAGFGAGAAPAGFGLATSAWDWEWLWPDDASANAGGLTAFCRVRVALNQVGPLVAILLLFAPLARATSRDVLAHACAVVGVLSLTLLLASSFGPWSGCIAVAIIAGIASAFGIRAGRWLPHLLTLLGIALTVWWVVVLLVAFDGPQLAGPLWVVVAMILALCAGGWSLRRLVRDRFHPWFEGGALFTAVIGVSVAAYSQGLASFRESDGSLAVLLASLSIGSACVSVVARLRSSEAVAVMALLPLVPAMSAMLAIGVVVVLGNRAPVDLGSSPLWALACLAPLASIAVSRAALRPLIADVPFLAPIPKHGGALLLVWIWCTAVTAGSVAVGGPLPAPAVIASLALAGAIGLYVGFRTAHAGFRWIGLGMFSLLALRLFAVDLIETSTMFRVAVLFATGVVLVGTSIAYTLVLKPKPSARD